MQLSDPQAFLDYVFSAYESEKDFETIISEIKEIQFSDSFDLLIKLKGDQWGGFVDYSIANFVIRLQKDVINLYNEVYEDKLSLKSSKSEIDKIAVRIKIKPGCTELLIKFSNIIKNLASKLTNKQKLYVITLLILCGFGTITFSVKKYIDAQIADKVQDEETKRELIQLNRDTMKFIERNQSAMRYLSNHLDEQDKIDFPSINEELDKRSAVLQFESELEQEKLQTYEVDDNYELTIFNFESGMVTLRKGKIKFQSSTEALSEKIKLHLHDLAAKDDVRKVIPKIDLQVSATISNNKIINSFITGIGKKRPSATLITDALSVKSMDIKEDQYTLLSPIP